MKSMIVDDGEQPGGSGVELTETESELYDRQIRLWGLESQKRLRIAKVLISGLNGIGAEVTKNIILSGVHTVRLHDDQLVTDFDFRSQFLVPRSALGKNRAEASIERAKKLNPMVEISADTEALSSKDGDFFAKFDVVVVSGANNEELLRIDELCRERAVKFFASDVWGTFGFCFADLQAHTFIEDIMKHKLISEPNEKTKTELVAHTVQRELKFPSYAAVLAFDVNAATFQRKLRRTGPALIVLRVVQEFRALFKRDPSYKTRDTDTVELNRLRAELCPDAEVPEEYFAQLFVHVSSGTAIVGGVLAQEIIKVISKKEAPHCNVFLFDPTNCCGFVETIGL